MAAARRGVGNLPAELTSFVGRRGEVAEVRRLLADSRLVTLTGVDGGRRPGWRCGPLGETAFQAAYHRGLELPAADTFAYAPATASGRLVARGRSNKEIAAQLVRSSPGREPT
jgi:hypothetical protein